MRSISAEGFRKVYEFGGFRLDPLARVLYAGSASLPLTPKAFDTLLVLVDRRGEVISKNDLMDAVWAETAVEENNLTQQIAALRRIFREWAGDHRFIVTLPGKGYSFVAPVNELEIAAAEEFTVMEATRSSVTIDISKTALGWWRGSALSSSMRGYALAVAYVLFVCLLSFWPTIFGAGHPQTIAVLSFRTAAEDKALSVGIRDTLRARLGSLEDVAVRPARVDLTSDDALIAGRELDADVVLTGSIQRENDRVRVSLEIVDVNGEKIIWGNTFDYDRSELFELQDAVAVEAMRVIKASNL
jgi:DNA-binding winged helix-turn-helix (wHTH) protein/TolB-like protein